MSDGDNDDMFLGVLRDRKGLVPRHLRLSGNKQHLLDWAKTNLASEGADSTIAKKDNSSSLKSSSLSDLLNRAFRTSEQQSEAIALINVVGQMLPMMTVQSDVLDHLSEKERAPEDIENFEIFKVKSSDYPLVTKGLQRANIMAGGLDQLPGAFLLSMVATFDSQMSDIVRAMLKIKSDRLRYGDKTVPLRRIMSDASKEEIIEEAISDEVYAFLRGSHSDQVDYIETHFSLEIKKSWKRWCDLIEVFERRNLVAHGERYFTKRYIDITSSAGLKNVAKSLGNEVQVSINYLAQCLDLLTEFSVLTAFMLWRKHVPSEEGEAFGELLEVAYNSTLTNRPRLAERICEFALGLKNTSMKEATRLRFVVNLASALRHLDMKEAAFARLDAVDWSATSDDFRICVAALREDVDQVNEILPMIKASEKIDLDSFRTWPVFNFIKNDKKFVSCFERIFEASLSEDKKRSVGEYPAADIEKPHESVVVEEAQGSVH